MGASEHIRAAMKDKGIKTEELSKAVGKPTQSIYNMIYRNTMKFAMVEEYADVLGCDVVLRDRETGKIY